MRPTFARVSAAISITLLGSSASASLGSIASAVASPASGLPPALAIVMAGLGVPPGACLVEDGDFATAEGGCKDLATGLVWGQGSTAPDAVPGFITIATWDEAVMFCEDSTQGNHGDWFLPNVDELAEVMANGGVGHLNVWDSVRHWTSTTRGSQRAWMISFAGSVESVQLKSSLVSVVCARVAAPASPPAAPTGLSATATSSGQIDLTWTDNATDEAGFQIDRSLNGIDWGPLTTVSANTTSYPDTGLAASTTFWYRVKAYNSAADSVYSNTASAMTSPGAGGPALANGEFTIDGEVTIGSYLDTHFDDGVFETVREELTHGNPANRTSLLEHKWTFNVQDGTGITLQARAISYEEDFDFAWSLTDGNDYEDAGHFIGTILSGGDEQTLDLVLPAAISGTVYVRVIDTDRTPGNTNLDRVFIDFISITTD